MKKRSAKVKIRMARHIAMLIWRLDEGESGGSLQVATDAIYKFIKETELQLPDNTETK